MADEKAGGEPSMEEILASIRQIINQNEKPAEGPADMAATPALESVPAAPAPTPVAAPSAAAVDDAPEDDDVLVLTDILNEAVPEPAAQEPALEMVELPEPMPVHTPVTQPVMPAPSPVADTPTTGLISNTSAAAATAALSSLANTLQQERMEHSLPLGNGMRTLESMAVEALKPLLKEWLDANLPAIVERIVQQEVEKLTKRLGG